MPPSTRTLVVALCMGSLAICALAQKGTLYYSANNSLDFSVYSLDLESPEGEPQKVATAPASVSSVAVHVPSSTLFFSADNTLFSCPMEDGACDMSTPPEPVETYENYITSLRMTKSGVLLAGEGSTVWYGKVSAAGAVKLEVLTKELDSARSVSSSQDTVVACCKNQELSVGKRDHVVKIQLPSEANPLPKGGYGASEMEFMWPVSARYIEATDAGTVWFFDEGMPYVAYIQSKGYQSVNTKEVMGATSACASGPFWSGPLIFKSMTSAGTILKCSDSGCMKVDKWVDLGGDHDIPYPFRGVAVAAAPRLASVKLEEVHI